MKLTVSILALTLPLIGCSSGGSPQDDLCSYIEECGAVDCFPWQTHVLPQACTDGLMATPCEEIVKGPHEIVLPAELLDTCFPLCDPPGSTCDGSVHTLCQERQTVTDCRLVCEYFEQSFDRCDATSDAACHCK